MTDYIACGTVVPTRIAGGDRLPASPPPARKPASPSSAARPRNTLACSTRTSMTLQAPRPGWSSTPTCSVRTGSRPVTRCSRSPRAGCTRTATPSFARWSPPRAGAWIGRCRARSHPRRGAAHADEGLRADLLAVIRDPQVQVHALSRMSLAAASPPTSRAPTRPGGRRRPGGPGRRRRSSGWSSGSVRSHPETSSGPSTWGWASWPCCRRPGWPGPSGSSVSAA